MNKQEIYDYLNKQNIWHEITEHDAVCSMSELISVELPYPECDAKNIFIHDDKRQHFYLITVKGDKRLNSKQFRKSHAMRPISFASDDELMDLLGVKPGSVTPLGLLNDRELRVEFFIDSDFWQGRQLIGVHPCENTATVWLKIDDLIDLIRRHGNLVNVEKF